MALTTNEEVYFKQVYQNNLIEKQIEEKQSEMWAEIDKIMNIAKDADRWENRRLKKLEYYEMIQDLEAGKQC